MKRQRGDIMFDLILYGIIAAAALGLIAVVYHSVGNYFRAPVEAKLAEQTKQTETAVAANQSLQSDLATLKAASQACSDQVAKLGDETQRMTIRAQAALDHANADATPLQQRADELVTIASQPGGDNACSDANALLLDYAKQRLLYDANRGKPSPDDSGKGSGADALRIH